MKKYFIFYLFFLSLGLNLAFAEEIPVKYFQSLSVLTEAQAPQTVKILMYDQDQKATILKQGILLTFKNHTAKSVKIAGDFNDWTPQTMNKGNNGVWFYFLTDSVKNKDCRYKFLCDNVWIADQHNFSQKDDQSGDYFSVINFDKPIINKTAHTEITENEVDFKIYKPQAYFISVVGDFNNWNPENDLLTKNKNGVWHLNKELPKGTYRYQFVIDGRWTPEIRNIHNASDQTGKICSIIKIK